MKYILKPLLILISILWISFQVKAIDGYKDTSLPIEERVNDLISRMTLSEKIAQLGHKSAAISRLGVASYNYWNEAIHGVARSGLATSFPVSIALSSTWDPELIYEVATAISDEARVKNNTEGKGLTYWSPTVNMARDPRWGRSEENYGEDVYLSSQIAVNFIKGMQGNDPNYLKTVATMKHFAANNVEKNRYGISSNIDERSLREYYLPVFKNCVTEGKVFSVMSAYNAVNGVPCPANRTLLTNILRNEWGFNGFVVSDCDAVGNVWDSHVYVKTAPEATAISLLNGNDLNCGTTFPDNAQLALDRGLLKEEDIDRALKNVFKARFLLGEFDPASSVPYKSIPASQLDCQENRDLALKAAKEAIVLLKNENSFLPLNKDSIKTIALIGPSANAAQLGGYSGTPSISVSTLQGIANKMGIDISKGVIEAETFSTQSGAIRSESCEEGGSNIGYIQNNSYVGYDSIDFGEGKEKIDIRVASEANGGNIEVFLDNLSGQSLGKIEVPATGAWQAWTTISLTLPQITGLHTVYFKFTGTGKYLFNINWFRIYNTNDIDPTAGGGAISLAAGCTISGPKVQADFDKAVEFARNSDIAVVVCGTDLSIADEGNDRSSINLPGVQEQLIQAVYAANPKTIVILVTGASLAINWTQENVPAILCSWYNGQAQGTAIADVLFGDYNPAGRLSTTWYKSINDLPAMSNYDVKNNRTYMYFEGTPLYPFGYGLSYTEFTYSNFKTSAQNLSSGDSITISADITNTGKIAGDEVVQLYVHTNSLSELRPKKQLKGFSRIKLQPGETKTVNFTLKHQDLEFYDPAARKFIVEAGNVDLYIGSSSEDIWLDGRINTTAGIISSTYTQNPFVLVEAETFENKSTNVKMMGGANGIRTAEFTGNNSYIVFKNFNFETAGTNFIAKVSSLDAGSKIDIVLDDLNGTVAGSLAISATGNLDSFKIEMCSLSEINGIHNIYLVLKGASSTICRINWFSFNETVTGINDMNLPNQINDFDFKVYPNPTSSTFTVNYRLPVNSNVKVEICSFQGALLKSVKLPGQNVGPHQIEIDANTAMLNPGMYILKFNADGFTQSKLLLIN